MIILKKFLVVAAVLILAPISWTVADYMAIQTVDGELDFVERIWKGKGIVLVGQLEVPHDAEVATRTRLFPDGSFATALYPGRTLTFFAHGYDPLPVRDFKEIHSSVFDAGVLRFSPTDAKQKRSVSASISLGSATNADTAITARLVLRNSAFLLADEGSRGGPIEMTVVSRSVGSGAPISFDGLSRIPYTLELSAPGFIREVIGIDPAQDGNIDLGEIPLGKAVTYEIRYRARIRQQDQEWITDDQIKSATVCCDGIAEFKFTDERDGLGNGLRLRMRSNKDAVEASFFYFKPTSFCELDAGDIHHIGTFDSIRVNEGGGRAILRDGGLYLFKIEDVNGTDIELVFQPKRL